MTIPESALPVVSSLMLKFKAFSSGDPMFDLLCMSLAVSALALILGCIAILRQRTDPQVDSLHNRLDGIESLLSDLKNVRATSSVELRASIDYLKLELTSLRSELGELSDQVAILEKVVRLTPSLQPYRTELPNGRRPTL